MRFGVDSVGARVIARLAAVTLLGSLMGACVSSDRFAASNPFKNDPELRRIPVVVFSTSVSEDDVLMAYNLHANCYIPKPTDMSELIAVIRCIEEFWLTRVRLPAD